MARTYYPGAVAFANVTHRYLTRYQAKLSQDKTTNQINALLGLITCLANFLVEWPKTPVEP